MAMRRCATCLIEKPMEEIAKTGHRKHCYVCSRKYTNERKRFRKLHPELTRPCKPREPKLSKTELEAKKRHRIKHPEARLISSAKTRAKAKGLVYDLNRDEITKRIMAGYCEVTGLPFDYARGDKGNTGQRVTWLSPSIDRINPEKGYTMDNVRVIIWGLNAMANAWGFDPIFVVTDALKKNGYKPTYEQRKVTSYIDSFCVGA